MKISTFLLRSALRVFAVSFSSGELRPESLVIALMLYQCREYVVKSIKPGSRKAKCSTTVLGKETSEERF